MKDTIKLRSNNSELNFK